MSSTPPFRLETVIGHGVCDGILAIRHLKESAPSALVPITAVLIAILLYIWGRIHSRQPEIFSCPFLFLGHETEQLYIYSISVEC